MIQDNQINFIVGPTAVGKTDVSIELAKHLGAEIISCDSMQVYKEIHIASAKPEPALRAAVKHHCLDLVSVTEEFNVDSFRVAALSAMEDIRKRGKQVLFCGGSGLYMTVMLDGIFEQASRDPVIREQLQKQAIVQGVGALHRRLKELDPVAGEKIHYNDAKRIVRALEVCLTAGIPMSQMQQERQGLWGQMPIKIIGLDRPREELYERVEARIDRMFQEGLVEEIGGILKLPLSLTSKTLIGIPEVRGYLEKDYGIEEARYLMKLHTRHFVKRQMTWFRRDKRVEWVDAKASVEQILDRMK